MKRLLSLSVFLMMALLLFAHDFEVKNADGVTIYYNITSSSGTTVAVTFRGKYYEPYYNAYTGAVNIPSTVTYIGKKYSVTSIDHDAFRYCSGLTSITIPNSVTRIGHDAFYGCSGLTSVTIPSSVTSIGDDAFYGCRGLTSVTIPNSVTSIGDGAFAYCSGLTSIVVGKNNTKYDSRDNCNAIIEAASNTLIRGCKTTVIPNSVTSIGDYAFSDCSSLTSITIPNSVTSIGSYAFDGCSGLTSFEIPNGVTSIGSYAFTGCSGLTSVTIPNSVTSIGGGAFSDLTSIVVEKGNTMYDSRDNCNAIIETATNTLICGCKATVIPNSVTNIGSSAFYGCSGLTSVTIPNSVTTIGGSAFYNCSGLTSIEIPNGVTSIGDKAFSGCSGLTSVTINSNSIISNTYSSESNLKNIFGSQVKSYIIGDGVTSIGSYAFYKCSGLTSVTIPNSVTSIGNYAFYDCSGLSSFMLPDNITTINSSSFPSSTKLYVNIGTKTLLELWRFSTYSNIYNKETEQKISRPTLSASATQTTLKVFVNEKLDCYTYTCDGKIITDNFFEKKGLRPGEEKYIRVDISLGYFSRSIEQSFSTKGLNPVVKGAASASSISATSSYSAGDAKIVKHELSCNGKKVEGTNTSFCGLKPNTSYKVRYTITAAYGENNEKTATYTTESEIKTSELTMTTEQPKVVSVGNVIVSAKANVDDAETNVGFEWRRTDWTDDFKSNTGTAYMYEGTMEGYIRNLNAEKLWKFRPYYLADDGTYYYGDWMGLDPTNTSYFEPTVHTYANINVEGNTALVKGYALGGTDKITVQGFKYWKAANLAPSGDLALEARKASPAIPADAQTIEAEGRVMEATLSGLDYECTYSYVAFAKTDEGTFYGEVKTFTTGPDATGIEVVRVASSEAKAVDDKVKGIYTLTGVKLSDDAADLKTLKRGIYIVNGRKVAVK
ncbi:MAG: leucine-rich repeat domain-containing protein [Prevotella sp.]|nr:leucine-rich repeat domain-containing protein [Prevotella sp.]